MPSASTQEPWPLEQGQHQHLQQHQLQQQQQQQQQQHLQLQQQLEQQHQAQLQYQQQQHQHQQQVNFLERKLSKRTRLETEEDMSVDAVAAGQTFVGFDSQSGQPHQGPWAGAGAAMDGSGQHHHPQFIPTGGMHSGHSDPKRRKGDWSEGSGSSIGDVVDGMDTPMEIA
ncbi:hypothetical protein BGZ91_004203 [Linnemannia elongata]|nr:hypothetical protein BGZ91_004203 [Linnemannia elongata]